MSSNFSGKREKIVWFSAAGVAFAIFISSLGFSLISNANLNSQLASVQNSENKIKKSVEEAQAIQTTLENCNAALESAAYAYDDYWSAYLGWTDEFDVMLNYGIFAADTVALIAIPQVAAEGDDYLLEAKSISCG